MAMVCTCAVNVPHATSPTVLNVNIELHFDRTITSACVKDGAKAETEAIWAEHGVAIAWTANGVPAPPADVTLRAIVDRQHVEELPRGEDLILGRAFVRLDTPDRRPIRVSFSAIERLLAHRASRPREVSVKVHDIEMGRGIGRVLSHELGHVLLGAPYHEREGLMRAAFHGEELGDPDRGLFRLTKYGAARLLIRVPILTAAPRVAATAAAR